MTVKYNPDFQFNGSFGNVVVEYNEPDQLDEAYGIDTVEVYEESDGEDFVRSNTHFQAYSKEHNLIAYGTIMENAILELYKKIGENYARNDIRDMR